MNLSVRAQSLILKATGIKWMDTSEKKDSILKQAYQEVSIKDEPHLVSWFEENLTPAERYLYLNDLLKEHAQRILRQNEIPA